MKKMIKQLTFEELSKEELKNVNSIVISGSTKVGGNTDGMSGPCGAEPDPSQMTPRQYAIEYALWIDCKNMYDNPGGAGTCIF